MTDFATQIATLLAAGALTAGGLLGGTPDGEGPARPALVVDAALARDGRDLVDPRLEAAGTELRVPRSAAEARTNVRYLAAQGRPVVVLGPNAGAAARATGLPVQRAPSVDAALAALRR